MMTKAESAWAYIEHLLVEECGLRSDEGLASERANMINAIENALPSIQLLRAAAEMIQDDGIAATRVDGKLLNRIEVCNAIAAVRLAAPS